jgi:hypothetical protein
MLRRYTHLVNQDKIFKHPDYKWCMIKAPQCGRGQMVNIKPETPFIEFLSRLNALTLSGSKSRPRAPRKWECLHCGHLNCLSCKDTEPCEYHRPQIDDTNKSQSDAEIRRTTKRCPRKGCGKPIQLSGGCNHVRCAKACEFGTSFL